MTACMAGAGMVHLGRCGYGRGMGLMKKAVYLGVAKKIYDEARKPENQRRINEAVASLKQRRAAGRSRRTY